MRPQKSPTQKRRTYTVYSRRTQLDSMSTEHLLKFSKGFLNSCNILFDARFYPKVSWLIRDIEENGARPITQGERNALMGFVRGVLRDNRLVLRQYHDNGKFELMSEKVHAYREEIEFILHDL